MLFRTRYFRLYRPYSSRDTKRNTRCSRYSSASCLGRAELRRLNLNRPQWFAARLPRGSETTADTHTRSTHPIGHHKRCLDSRRSKRLHTFGYTPHAYNFACKHHHTRLHNCSPNKSWTRSLPPSGESNLAWRSHRSIVLNALINRIGSTWPKPRRCPSILSLRSEPKRLLANPVTGSARPLHELRRLRRGRRRWGALGLLSPVRLHFHHRCTQPHSRRGFLDSLRSWSQHRSDLQGRSRSSTLC